MGTMLTLHVASGGVGLVSGFTALFLAKGSRPHRAMGRVFVFAMIVMGLSGAFIAAVTGVETSVIMGSLAAYLVFTGMTTVAPIATGGKWIGLAGAAVAFSLAVALAELGLRALAMADGVIEGLPAPMAFLFAAVAASAAASDVRRAFAPPLTGGKKLARHLWRMCFALFIAAASFFLGQTGVLPEPLRGPLLLAIPVLAPLLVMAFWIWRTRSLSALRAVHHRAGYR